MKKVLIAAAVLLLAAAAGGYAFWQREAERARDSVEKLIAQANGANRWFTYASLSTSGFPLRVTVTVHQPVITIPTGKIVYLAALTRAMQSQGAVPAQPADWNDTLRYGDALHIHLPLGRDTVTIASSGPARVESAVSGETLRTLQQPEGDSSCTLELSRGGRGTIGAQLAEGAYRDMDLAAYFRAFRCDFAAASWVNEATGQAVSHNGPIGFSFATEPQEGRRTFAVTLRAPSVEFTPAADEMFARYARILDADGDLGFSLPASAQGKQQTMLDLRIDTPFPFNTASREKPLAVELTEFTLKNALFDASLRLSVHHTPGGGGSAESVSTFEYRGTVTPEYMTGTRHTIAGQLLHMARRPGASSALRAFAERTTPVRLAERLEAVLPRLDTLGVMTIAWEGRFNATKDMAVTVLDLKRAEAGFTPYGLNAAGQITRTSPDAPAGEIAVTCRQCEPMIGDIGGWARRMAAFLREFSPEQADAAARLDGLGERLAHFVKTIGKPSGAGDYRFTLSSTAEGGMSVNGRSMAYVREALENPVSAAQ